MILMISPLTQLQREHVERQKEYFRGNVKRFLEVLVSLDANDFEQLNIFLTDQLGMSGEPSKEPDYLTTSDVAFILDISPQMVRKHCIDGSIKAWRTLGDRGEWRIDIEPFRDNPRFNDLLQKIESTKSKNRVLVKNITHISTNPEYQEVLRKVQENRDKERKSDAENSSDE